jgi:hypothetical protein
MSKQQSLAPNDQEIPRHSNGSRKAKPWILWMHLPSRGTSGQWWRRGRYVTRKTAEEAAAKSSLLTVCTYRIMHENEGKPA